MSATGWRRAPQRWRWLDLRLVPVAATAWLSSLVAPSLAVRTLVVVAAAAGVLTPVLLGRREPRVLAVAGALAALALTASAAAARGSAREASPLRAVAAGLPVGVTLQLSGDPQAVAGPGPGRVAVDATVTRVAVGGGTVQTHDPAVVFAPADGWDRLLPGQRVQARAVVSRAPSQKQLVAVLSARGPPSAAAAAGVVQRGAASLRSGLARTSGRVVGGAAGGLLPGLVLGDTAALDPLVAEDFRAAGLTHLVAVSGLNVTP